MDHPDLEVVYTDEDIFSSLPALMTVADFTHDEDDMKVVLYSVIRDGVGYSLGQLGEEEDDLYQVADDLIEPMWRSFYFLD